MHPRHLDSSNKPYSNLNISTRDKISESALVAILDIWVTVSKLANFDTVM